MGDHASPAPAPLERSRSRSSTVRFLRRSSTNDRLNEILDNARDRADTLTPDAGPNDVTVTSSPSTRANPLTARRDNPSPSLAAGDAVDERTPDESTIMVSGSAGAVGYQTLRTSEYDSAPRRTKSSIYAKPQAHPAHGPEIQDDGRPHHSSSGGDRPTERELRVGPSWWKQTTKRFRSVELENKGSVARDHLALERTFLAWLRTSLAFASIGIAVTQLFRLNTSLADKKGPQHPLNNSTLRHMGKPLGATFLAISILTLLLGYRRYVESQEWVIKGKFPASRGTIALLAFVSFGIMIVSLVVVIVISPTVNDDRDL